MNRTRWGEKLHESLEVLESFAHVSRKCGLTDEQATRIGHYAALRFAGVPIDRALHEVGITTKHAGDGDLHPPLKESHDPTL